jgi:valyl-tRNA synthetase
MALEKTYNPSNIETKWYDHWETSGAFKASGEGAAEPYTIVIPPPNVTGSLHMGHALDNTLQDVLIRFERMRGKDTLWQVGVDHAGIATQMVVERQLDAEGTSRREMGREAFLERVWAWKAESGDTITRQLRRLGASCDWSRERFTMDEGFCSAVPKVFAQLYNEGLLYKAKRLVNWDPGLLTAISDLEVEQKEVNGHLWYFKYPIEGEDNRYVVVATTRPETMLGDTAVAVHPDDARYKDLVGKQVRLPLTDRLIPIVADEWADPEQGSGAVKITPAHDFNDFEVGKRHGLEPINIFDAHAALNENTPEKYRGLDRFEARRVVVADLEALGLVEKIEPHTHPVPYGDRGGVVIEPRLMDQWYVDAPTLTKPAIEAVEKGDTRFIPKNWEKTYFEWMRNIQPWCVSRQLWWGHRIPAWYTADGSIYVAESEEAAYNLARADHGEGVKLTQDEDVLDTWFSSALWPFATLGWPEDTPEVARYYPNTTLVTGFDIIFFWVARMMMMGLHFKGEVPFKDVYIHALVRDEKGAKMSKSKGNVIDPLDYIEKYGADALRFTLAAMEAQGRDIKLSESRVEGYRNFGTKLWNACRFAEMNGCFEARDHDFDPASVQQASSKWVLVRVAQCNRRVTRSLEEFRYNDSADAIYHFAWHMFCDSYVELTKVIFWGDDEVAKAETRNVTAWVIDQILKMLHPFMPFITEELWHSTGDHDVDLIAAQWSNLDDYADHRVGAEEIAFILFANREINSARAEFGVPAGKKLHAIFKCDNAKKKEWVSLHEGFLMRRAQLAAISIDGEYDASKASNVIVEDATFILMLGEVSAEEKERLVKALENADKAIAALDARLGNQNFIAKAKPEAVEKARAQRADEQLARDKLAAALKRLD